MNYFEISIECVFIVCGKWIEAGLFRYTMEFVRERVIV